MAKVIEEWDVTKKGDYLLTLDSPIPDIKFDKYRIDGEIYSIIPVSLSNYPPDIERSWCIIGLKSPKIQSFIGKEVEFITA